MQMKVCFYYQEFVSSSNLDPQIERKSAKMQEEDEDSGNEHARDASNIHTPSPSPLPPPWAGDGRAEEFVSIACGYRSIHGPSDVISKCCPGG